MNVIKLAFIALISTASAFADDNAVQKFRNYTPQQVQEMPENIRKSEMPMMYIFAARRGLAVDSELLFGMELNHLMYPGIHDYKTALRNFQTDLGDKPTGVLTVWQIHQLEYRSQLQKLSRVSFPNTFGSIKTAAHSRVQGTITLLDEKIAWPINHIKINCTKSENLCEARQVMLIIPNDKSWAQQYQVMVDEVDYYDITRWTDDVIDAELPSTKDSCRTTSLNLNFRTKEFFFITKNAGGKCEFMGTALEKLPRPRVGQVIDGTKIIDGEFQKLSQAAYAVLSNDFRKKVEKASTPTSRR